MKRGEVWLAQIDPTEAREIQKTRPCLIVSPPEIHDLLNLAIVAPMTTGNHPAPYRIEIKLKDRNGRFLLEQIPAIDKSRLLRRVGTADAKTLSAVMTTLREMFAE